MEIKQSHVTAIISCRRCLAQSQKRRTQGKTLLFFRDFVLERVGCHWNTSCWLQFKKK